MTATLQGPLVLTPDRLTGPSYRHGFLIALLIVSSTVSWRTATLYEGGVDPVVLGKAALSGLALGTALIARNSQLRPAPLSAAPMWFLTAFLTATMFGAYVASLVVVSAVIVVRIVILAVVGYLFVRAFGYETAVRCWLTAMATVGLVAAVTGLPSLASGRLRGGFPEVHPNEVATLSIYPALGIIWLFLNGRSRPHHAALLPTLLVVTWATGSRTALGAVVLGAAIMVASLRRPTPSQFIALVMSAAGFLFIALGTDLLSRVLLRGGREEITSLSSRSIGWSAALTYTDDAWRKWMGAGIAKRRIEVQGQYWDSQVLDSSWISAYVQAGRVGVIVLTVWLGWIVWNGRHVARPGRVLIMAMVAAMLVQSVTESGLVDSSVSFVTFWLVSLTCATAAAHRWQQHTMPVGHTAIG